MRFELRGHIVQEWAPDGMRVSLPPGPDGLSRYYPQCDPELAIGPSRVVTMEFGSFDDLLQFLREWRLSADLVYFGVNGLSVLTLREND